MLCIHRVIYKEIEQLVANKGDVRDTSDESIDSLSVGSDFGIEDLHSCGCGPSAIGGVYNSMYWRWVRVREWYQDYIEPHYNERKPGAILRSIKEDH